MERASRRVVILVAAGVLVVGLAGVAATGAAGAVPANGQALAAATPNPSSVYNFLGGVSAVSASDAWAVGSYDDNTTGAQKTLILHWNGTAWSQVDSPDPGPVDSELDAVSAVSGSDAWAVGIYWNGAALTYDTLILHWNGTVWSQVDSPNPSSYPGSNYLLGVSAVSGSDAWAVGNYMNNTTGVSDSLILHWDGSSWSRVDGPTARYTDFGLDGVSAVSGSDAWAVGSYGIDGSDNSDTLVLHWNGTSWSQVDSPSPGSGENSLGGVSALSGSDAWAVGSYSSYPLNPYTSDTLVLHWDGTAWSQVDSPSPSSVSYNFLQGVSAVSGSDAWAVGISYVNEVGGSQTLILHWDGTAWTQVDSPNPSCPDYAYSWNTLYGVSAHSGSDAWAVGDYGDCATATGKAATLIAHWNGTAWANLSIIPTSTAVSSSSNPVTTGSPVTYTATVAPTPQGGTVDFYDNGSLISSCSQVALNGTASATCSLSYASAGSHTIKAAYSGYADLGGSTSPSFIEMATSCGTWRWPVKTGSDADRFKVSQTVDLTSIHHLVGLTAPSSFPDYYQDHRFRGAERHTWQLTARLTQFRLQDDGDIELVLKDRAGRHMIADIPKPGCVASSSLWTAAIKSARANFTHHYRVTTAWHYVRREIIVRGLGFFDKINGATGQARNGIELHPVTIVKFP